jgi:hypothetical protein
VIVVMMGMCMPFRIDDAIYDECGEGATVDGRVLAALLKPRLVMWTVEGLALIGLPSGRGP